MREEQRARILDGARKVFAQKGMAATMAEVAAAAEVSQGLAYRYFENKEAIFKELLEQTVQVGISGLSRFLEMSGTPGERLAYLIERTWNSRRERPEMYELMYQLLHDESLPDRIRTLVEKQGLAFAEVIRKLIVEGQATGEVAEGDPDQMMTLVLVSLDGLSRWALSGPEQFGKSFPDASLILRIFKPESHPK